MNNTSTDRLERSAIWVAIVTSIAACVFNGCELKWQRDAAEDAKISQWQATELYWIILSANPEGMSFERIRDAYTTASQRQEFEIPKDKLTDAELRRLLFEMVKTEQVTFASDKTFWVNRSTILPRSERIPQQTEATYAVMQLIDKAPGSHTAESLRVELEGIARIEADEFSWLLNNCLATRMVLRDQNQKLWPATSLVTARIQGDGTLVPAPAGLRDDGSSSPSLPGVDSVMP